MLFEIQLLIKYHYVSLLAEEKDGQVYFYKRKL